MRPFVVVLGFQRCARITEALWWAAASMPSGIGRRESYTNLPKDLANVLTLWYNVLATQSNTPKHRAVLCQNCTSLLSLCLW